MKKWSIPLTLVLMVYFSGNCFGSESQSAKEANKDSRCPVCGMFVAKYPQWLTQIKMSDGSVVFFDGVKDMMAYYLSPQQFGAPSGVIADQILVKAYYNQKWIDGKRALYVIGSDVYGPMGHELIPFEAMAGAENFKKDHQGDAIYSFLEISHEIVEGLRKGHKM